MRFQVQTSKRAELLDVTERVEAIAAKSGVANGICLVYAPHATAAVIITEYEPALVSDLAKFFDKLAPAGDYAHNAIDDNAEAHIKSALLGCGKAIPIENGRLALGTWQSVVLCEFDGPRTRTVNVVIK